MNANELTQIVMDNMPSQDGSRTTVESYPSGNLKIVYTRPYGPKYGFGGWRATEVSDNGQAIEPDPNWVVYA